MQKKKKEEKKKKRGEKTDEKQQQTKTNGHGKHGDKKGKTGGTTTELPTNTPALSKKQNEYEAKNHVNNSREKQKPKGKQKLGWPVHILDQRKPGLGKNSGTLTGPRRSHGTSRSTSQFVPNMLFSI